MNKRHISVVLILAAIAVAIYLGLGNRRIIDTRSDAEKSRAKVLAQKVLQFRFPGIPAARLQFRNAFVHDDTVDIHDVSISYAGQTPINIRIERARYPVSTAEPDRYNYDYDIKGLTVSLASFPPPAAFALQQLGYDDLVFDVSGKQSLDSKSGIYQLEFNVELRGDARLRGFLILDRVSSRALRESETGNYQRLLTVRFVNARLSFEDTGLLNRLMKIAIGQDREHIARMLEQRKTISKDPREISAINALQGLLRKRRPLIVTARPHSPVPLGALLENPDKSLAVRLDLRISNP